ncbi:MAG: hypothetical protein JWM77_1328 [Rhodospirillales bacterium]|nr:hypothetical protein [Rhodospirillales bacterium]
MFDGLLRSDDPACPVRLGPHDSILSFWSRHERSRIWTYCAVAHRDEGAWTHLYAIERLPAFTNVHLLKFWQGERLAAASAWMRERRGACARCIRNGQGRCERGDCDAPVFYEAAA